MQHRGLSIFSLVLILCIAAPVAVRADDSSRRQDELNGGYFLLHDLLNQEEGLPFLLDLKTAPTDIKDFAIRISKTSKSGLAVMKRMKDGDPQMNWEENPLPQIEQDIRASISDEKAHQLLFGSKGPDFARALLVSQAEASKYAANIAKVLAGRETDGKRRAELEKISAQWQEINRETFRLLAAY